MLMILKELSIPSSLAVGLLSLIAYKVINFYASRKNYPPGPFPLPIIGNISLRAPKIHAHDNIIPLCKKYGGVMTLWFASQPTVVVYDTKVGLEVLKSKAVAGRPHFAFADEVASKPGSINIPFSDFSREFEVLRKVTVAAIRKYATSDSLSRHVVHSTSEIIERMKKTPDDIDIGENLKLILLQLLATSAFGKDYSLEDEEFQNIVSAMDTLNDTDRVFNLVGLAPVVKIFFQKQWDRAIHASKYLRKLVKQRFIEHEETFEQQENRDFMDSLLWARDQAREEEDEELLKSVDSWTIQNSVANLFNAGSQTSRLALLWWFLHISLNQEMQEKIRKEVDTVLPNEDEMPTIDMREKTPYLMAFTAEVLRHRSVVPWALPHKTLEDTVIGGYKVVKGTTVLISLNHAMADESIWKDPQTFNPNRFIDAETGKFVQRPNNCFLPFSTGRRSCIGEKLAVANIYLIVMNIFQKTKGMRFEVTPKPKNEDERKKLLTADPSKLTFYEPFKYQLKLVKSQ